MKGYTMGEFRERTKDLNDDVVLLVDVAKHDTWAQELGFDGRFTKVYGLDLGDGDKAVLEL